MQIKKILVTGPGIAAVCLMFAVCMAVGALLSGIARLAPQTPSARGNGFLPLLICSFCVGVIASHLILRSNWRGGKLAG